MTPAAVSDAESSGMSLSALAAALNGRMIGEDVNFNSVSTDTRSLQRGDLFVALQGPNFDGHHFVGEARQQGACAVMVSRELETDLPQLLVDDTLAGLGRLAALWRDRFSIPVIGVTGSNGKTTVKEMLAAILDQSLDQSIAQKQARKNAVLVTEGNRNNDIGVPLTLMGLNEQHRFAVVEMGANHPGEIAYLTNIVRPTVALITNAAPAHLEGFGDINGVARAKGEIFSGLEANGTAVINADDAHVDVWRALTGKRPTISFAIDNDADVTATDIAMQDDLASSFRLCTPQGNATVTLGMCGRHNIMNALAASAAALAAGIALEDIRNGLERMRPVSGRLQIKQGIHGICVIDDTYNANPGSVTVAIEALMNTGSGKKVLVLGDMGELGATAQAFHQQVGQQARALGVDHVFAVGELAAVAVDTFGDGAWHFASQDELISALCKTSVEKYAPALTVLVKGSRNMHMERVVDTLTAEQGKRVANGDIGGGA